MEPSRPGAAPGSAPGPPRPEARAQVLLTAGEGGSQGEVTLRRTVGRLELSAAWEGLTERPGHPGTGRLGRGCQALDPLVVQQGSVGAQSLSLGSLGHAEGTHSPDQPLTLGTVGDRPAWLSGSSLGWAWAWCSGSRRDGSVRGSWAGREVGQGVPGDPEVGAAWAAWAGISRPLEGFMEPPWGV